MKAKIKRIELKEYETEDKRKFSKVEFTCDVENDKGDVKTLKASYNEDYAKKYLAYCGVKTKDIIGAECEVVTARRTYEKDGEKRIYNYIKFVNLLDDKGQPIIMPSEKSKELDF